MSNELLKQEIERAMENAPLQKALKNFTGIRLCGQGHYCHVRFAGRFGTV